jgi:aerobic-type carbon monoxide dehydrogenase small subunit (CoxS/CutS family)
VDTEKNKEETLGQISRREFLKDAGLVVGGAAIGSVALIGACNNTATETVNKTVTTTATKTVTTTAPGTGGTTVTVTSPPTTVVGDSENNLITITANGYARQVHVEPNTALRDVLRKEFGLISIKDMCTGYGACGSCTVLMNGRPILSCLSLACECDGAVIETAEGIAKSTPKLIDAYIKNYCMQCGYCTPGFVVTAKALLNHTPKPTEEDVKDALAGNICRCGTYPRHTLAVLEAVS